MIKQLGDTIIEVLLAITIFSMLSVGAVMVMNQGNNAAQRALEQTQVKLQIDAQTQMLRAIQQKHFSTSATNPDDDWSKIIGDDSDAPRASVGADNKCPELNNPIYFALNTRKGDVTLLKSGNKLKSMNDAAAPTFAQVVYNTDNTATPINEALDVLNAYGIWIERTKNKDTGADTQHKSTSYTFTVRACWYGPGSDVPMQLQSVVRLYDKAEVSENKAVVVAPPTTPPTPFNPGPTPPTTPPTPTSFTTSSRLSFRRCSLAGNFTNPIYTPFLHCNPPSPIYSCVDYSVDLRFRSSLPPGDYKLTLVYGDHKGNCSGYADPPSGYTYRINVRTDYGTFKQISLPAVPAGQNFATSDPIIIRVEPVTTINIEWINNCWVDIAGQCTEDQAKIYADPDLKYYAIKLERV
jgi:type II secretory pathway component PulJ